MKYRFWGWEHADAKAITAEYKGIETPVDLYDALSHVWCADTWCAADEAELDKRKYDTGAVLDHGVSGAGYLRR